MTGGPIPTQPLGTELPAREDIITEASNRLTTQVHNGETAEWTNLTREVDHQLMVHTGFTSAAPSRNAPEDREVATGSEIDENVAAHNTRQQAAASLPASTMPSMLAPPL